MLFLIGSILGIINATLMWQHVHAKRWVLAAIQFALVSCCATLMLAGLP